MRLASHLSAVIAAVAAAGAVAGAVAGRIAGGHGLASRLAVGAGVGALVVLGLRAGRRLVAAAFDLDDDDDATSAPRATSDEALLTRVGPILVGLAMVLLLVAPPASPAADGAPAAAALAQARVDAAARAHTAALARWRTGDATLAAACGWSVRWLAAVRDQVDGPRWQQALADHARRMGAALAEAIARRAAGTGTAADVDAAASYRVEAELWVARGTMERR